MPVQDSMQSFTAIAASNSPAGADAISNQLDNYLRAIAGVVRHTEASTTLTATASMSLAAAAGAYVHVIGTDAISHLGTVDAGIARTLVFDAAASLVPSANIRLPASATIVCAVGDVAQFRSEGSGVWRCTSYSRANGAAITPSSDAVVNVKDFGALGDGATDDIAAIDAAIAYVHGKGGGAVVFPIGTYRITREILISGTWTSTTSSSTVDHISLVGQGYSVIKKDAADGSMKAITIRGNHNTVRDLVVNGNGQLDTGIYVAGNYNTVQFCRVYNNDGTGIAQNSRDYKDTQGWYLERCNYNTICFNQVEQILGSRRDHAGIATWSARYGSVIGNRVVMNARDTSATAETASGWEGITGHDAYRNIYALNQVYGARGAGGFSANNAADSVWIGNISANNFTTGFQTGEDHGGSKDCALIGNVIADNDESGLLLLNETDHATDPDASGHYPKGFAIIGNVLKDNVKADLRVQMRNTGVVREFSYSTTTVAGSYTTTLVRFENGTAAGNWLCMTLNDGGSGTITSLTMIDPGWDYATGESVSTTLSGGTVLTLTVSEVGDGEPPQHLIVGNILTAEKSEFTLAAFGESWSALSGTALSAEVIPDLVVASPVQFRVKRTASYSAITGAGVVAPLKFDTIEAHTGGVHQRMGTWNIQNGTVLSESTLTSLQADGTYLLISTDRNTTGEIRGQISWPGDSYQLATVRLKPAVVVPPQISSGEAVATVTFDHSAGTIAISCNFWETGATATTTASRGATSCVLYRGAAGVTGSVVATLSGDTGAVSGHFTLTATTLPAADLVSLKADELYLQIASNWWPSGEMRGQLIYRGVPISVSLTGTEIVGGPVKGFGSATGTLYVELDRAWETSTASTTHTLFPISGSVVFKDLTSNSLAAGLYEGAAGVDGTLKHSLLGTGYSLVDEGTYGPKFIAPHTGEYMLSLAVGLTGASSEATNGSVRIRITDADGDEVRVYQAPLSPSVNTEIWKGHICVPVWMRQNWRAIPLVWLDGGTSTASTTMAALNTDAEVTWFAGMSV